MDAFEIKINDIKKDELATIFEALRQAAADPPITLPTPEHILVHNDKYCSQKDQVKRIIAWQNNEIIGGLIILKRNIIYHDHNLTLGGIGGVWIRRDKRRQGIASSLLIKAVTELNELGCDIAYLCTNIEKYGDLYVKVGFKPLPYQYTFIGKSGKRYFEWDGMIAPIKSQQLFNLIMNDNQPFDIGCGDW